MLAFSWAFIVKHVRADFRLRASSTSSLFGAFTPVGSRGSAFHPIYRFFSIIRLLSLLILSAISDSSS
jgi:hypothetical protein